MRYLFIFLLFAACTCDQVCHHYRGKDQEWYEDNGNLKVLATTAMIEDIVAQIGRQHIDTLTLIRGELDPHTYQLVKGDDEKVGYADIVFYTGLGLEHGPSLRKQLEESPNAYAVGDRIKQQDPRQILHYNGQIDPHIWMDISIWAKMVPHVVEVLSKADPQHADDYKANGDELYKEMMAKHQTVKKRLQKIPSSKRFLVTSHDAFNYFAKAYLATDQERHEDSWQKRFAAPEGLAPESQLSVRDIQEIIDHMRENEIHVLFPESNVSKDSIRKIVDAGSEYGLDLRIAQDYLYGDAIGKPGSDGDTYLKMVDYNAKTIAKHLKEPK